MVEKSARLSASSCLLNAVQLHTYSMFVCTEQDGNISSAECKMDGQPEKHLSYAVCTVRALICCIKDSSLNCLPHP